MRNILSGVEQIYLFDNNRIQTSLNDTDISASVAPFVDAGLLTLIPLQRDSIAPINDTIKHAALDRCLEQFTKPYCSWATVIDTDELWHPMDFARDDAVKDSSTKQDWSGIAQLAIVLSAFQEHYTRLPVGFFLGWDMAYNEHKLLFNESQLLLDEFPRTCEHMSLGKSWYIPERAKSARDHIAMPLADFSGTAFLDQTILSKHMIMIHYYQKSVEEWVRKKEQSFVEYPRGMNDSGSCTHEKIKFPYSDFYVSLVRGLLKPRAQNKAAHTWNRLLAPSRAIDVSDYGLYLVFKWAISRRYEWDEEEYLSFEPNQPSKLKEVVVKFADGMNHFRAVGFASGSTSPCFMSADGERLCPRILSAA